MLGGELSEALARQLSKVASAPPKSQLQRGEFRVLRQQVDQNLLFPAGLSSFTTGVLPRDFPPI